MKSDIGAEADPSFRREYPYGVPREIKRFVVLDETWDLIPGEKEYGDILLAIDRAKFLAQSRKVIIAKVEGVKYIDMSYWGPEGWSPTVRQRATHTVRAARRSTPRHRPMSP